MHRSWYKRLGYAFALMLSVIMMTGIKVYATDEIKLPIVVNPLYQEQAAEIEMELETLQGEALNNSDVVVYTSIDEAAKYVRQQMVVRSTTITYYVSADLYSKYGVDVISMVFSKAIEHTEDCSGQEGDALACGYRGISTEIACPSNGEAKVTSTITYYTNAAQEQELTEAVNNAISSLELNGKTDYEKVRAIYRYICNNVAYDYDNWKDDDYTLKYSAYAAMVNKKAVCQGYAVLFYRMCKEAGIPVRVISGTGNGDRHAWNIVKIGNYYYNADCTWDEQGLTNYFLKSEEDFGDHTRDEEYDTVEFHYQYVMSLESYDLENAGLEGADLDNFSYTYTTINDTKVTSTANGRPKVLIFFDTEDFFSGYPFSSLQYYGMVDADVIAIECMGHTKDEVVTFATEYGISEVQFCYDTSLTVNEPSMLNYAYTYMGNESDIIFPVIAYIDANNRLQYLTTDAPESCFIEENLLFYCGGDIVGDLSLSEQSITIDGGETHLIYAYEDEQKRNGDKYTWTSSNTKVATVDILGRVTGVGAGTATITCQASDGKKLTATVNVNGLASVNGKFIYLTNGVKDTTKTGLVLYDGQWFYVVKGELSTNSGFVKYNGETFYVGAGRVIDTANGLVEYNGEWYYVAAGRVVSEYTGLAEYDGAWFYINKGKMDPTKKGMVEYDGGLFYVGAGKIMRGVDGLVQDPVTGKWYYLADGQVQKQHTGLVLYNKAWFYVVKGEFATTYTGYVSYDGSQFKVVKGEVQL